MVVAIAAQSGTGAEATAWPTPDWQVAKADTQGMSQAKLDAVGDWLKRHGSKTGLVVRHGRIVGEWYFDDAKPSTRLLVWSTTKSFASTAAGLAIADGKLKLDTKLGELLPSVSPAEKRDITIRQLLSMTSGVHNQGNINELPNLFDFALTKAPMDHKPGERWDYNNTGLALLSPAMKQATGKEIDDYLDEKVLRPIGITRDDWTWERRQEQAIPYSGLHITARALARFGLMFLNQGKWRDRSIVPADWVAEAVKPSQELNKTYGYLWWNNSTGKWPGVPKDAYAALGRFENNMLIVPSLDLIVIRQIGEDPEPSRKMQIGELFKLAVEAVE